MNIEEVRLLNVERLQGVSTAKYLVIEVIGPDRKRKIVLRVGPRNLMHNDLLQDIRGELGNGGLEATALGGGMIMIKDQCITLYDESLMYGREKKRQQTADIIRELFPSHEVVTRE